VATAAGRVLIVGSRAESIVPRLSAWGYECETAIGSSALERRDAQQRPDAVVLASTARIAPTLLAEVRKRTDLRRIPVLIDGTEGWRASLQRLDVDGVAESFESLERQLQASLKARRYVEHDDLVRKRLELMLELTRLSVSGASIESLLRMVSMRMSEGLGCERVAVLQVQGGVSSRAALIDEDERTPIDLAVSPSFRRALEGHQPVETDGGWVVPLSAEVREVAALVVRRKQALTQEELDFLQAVGVALANAVERQQIHASAARSQEALQDAYVNRYKELVEANNRLRALDRKKNDIMAVLSHDLRAPLNVLLGYAHLLTTDQSLTQTHRAHSEAISRAGKKVLSLVESLLEQQRGNDGRIALFSRVFDVSEACQEAARELQLLAREKGLALRAEAPLSLDVFADDQKIKQVLQNLITNALTHAKGAKEVVVRARIKKRPDGDVALIEVRDDGKVEDPNGVLMAFERSAGLGLSICRDLVERHGGEIWAEAPSDGGAVFAFTLPMPAGQNRALPTRKSEPLVLLVDDDPIFSRIATMGLSGHYRVELARDGNEAVSRARALQPDVIIMDVFMPNRDGLDALRELQSRPETESIPVILLSARPELPERVRPAELGAADFVAKPLPPSVLLARVQAAVQRSRGRTNTAVGPGNDAETGLYDHIGLANHLDQELERSVRHGRPLALAVLKPLKPDPENVGQCATLIRRELQSPDFVGHLGNGVFVICMPETAADQGQALVGRLVGLLADERIPYRSRMGDSRDFEGGAELLLERLLA
jgi:signal transduction histidine kinase/DNA-binding response OmpR family regulator